MSSADARTHLVTGAASGIGREVATRLIERGDKVIALVRTDEQCEQLAHELPPHWFQIAPLDLADSRAVGDWAAAFNTGQPRLTRLDSVVHCAGYVQLGRVADEHMDDRQWTRHLAVNLIAPALLTKGCLPLLRETGGTVVLVNSTAGLTANPDWSAYAASKFGLRALADSLRAEEPGIRVTSVFPGRTGTKMQRDVHEMEGKAREYDASRWIQPGTVAGEILRVIDLPADATIPEVVLRPR